VTVARSPYLTPTQVAERLHVSAKTVSRWAKEGRLAHQRTLGGHRRYDPGQIDQLERELTVPTAQG
jgi:excisionase family DNA binding protein